MPTLKDVAKKSGVSLGTTSAVINNNSWVRESTRQRVLKAIEELNYKPNQSARNLRLRKTHTIGLIVPDITNPFFPQIIRSIDTSIRKHGYLAILCDSNEDFEIGLDNFITLLDKQVDGIIFIGGVVREQELAKYLKDIKTKIVVIEKEYEIPEIDIVCVNARMGGYDATKHLLNLGYETVGAITGPLTNENYRASFGRYKGYQLALSENNISLDPSLVKESDFTYHGGYLAMREFFKDSVQIRAIFAFNDLMALGAMEAIKEKGLRIPEDIAVVGYDDIPEASYSSPALTTVQLPKKQLGETAVEILMDKMRNKEDMPVKRVFQTKLIIRNSCGINLE
jgi:DNA-binding LacI/PurR family transcriptional regulator